MINKLKSHGIRVIKEGKVYRLAALTVCGDRYDMVCNSDLSGAYGMIDAINGRTCIPLPPIEHGVML